MVRGEAAGSGTWCQARHLSVFAVVQQIPFHSMLGSAKHPSAYYAYYPAIALTLLGICFGCCCAYLRCKHRWNPHTGGTTNIMDACGDVHLDVFLPRDRFCNQLGRGVSKEGARKVACGAGPIHPALDPLDSFPVFRSRSPYSLIPECNFKCKIQHQESRGTSRFETAKEGPSACDPGFELSGHHRG